MPFYFSQALSSGVSGDWPSQLIAEAGGICYKTRSDSSVIVWLGRDLDPRPGLPLKNGALMTRISLDFSEKGRDHDGNPISSNRRLFMQLQCFTDCISTDELIDALKAAKIPSVLYQDLNDPRGIALLCFHEQPEFFVRELSDFLRRSPFSSLSHRPHLTMTGRSYSIGYENNLDYVLVDRPMERVLNSNLPWAIWYPLRRKGEFEQLPPEKQSAILKEHGEIGFAFSAAEYGQDIRLACHGLDHNDNDFVIGIVGPQLAPLSALVQRMRKTEQTSKYLEKLGPFFIGHVLWQSEGKSSA